MMGRSPCCDESGLKKGPWTPEEDKRLVEYIQRHGHGSWRALPKLAGLNRCGKSCRLRWTNYLRPDIKRGKFSEEEEQTIVNLHSVLGNKWSAIASHLPGRTDNEIKNYWNTHLRKKLLHRGIDPVTHRPRADLQMFANLPQLLATAANLSSLMTNPLDNVLRLQSDATQLAKIHLLQTIFQVLSRNPSSQNSDLNSLLGAGSMPFQNQQMLDHLVRLSSQADGLANAAQLPCNFSCFEAPQTLHNDDIYRPPTATGRGQDNDCIDQFGNASNGFGIQSDAQMPPLVALYPEKCAVDKTEAKLNPKEIPNINPPPTSTTSTFECWSELLDDEASNSYWRDIIDQASSPSWPIS
ncbi:hypothetical protein Nepgr_010960 [Nepenthes gracilis]|uniref:Uncharacterized protein n=1 Tax=Nepenthes gracilis TaxID=150966 RepID=A0AAD3XLU5_NEPGR|nr:hypothetical protein Nepgr_010960 [Nepenthes gracilis]